MKNNSKANGIKTTTNFLWFPITIKNETRWFSKETIVYYYLETIDKKRNKRMEWIPIKFL
jgi:hypothetical protein